MTPRPIPPPKAYAPYRSTYDVGPRPMTERDYMARLDAAEDRVRPSGPSTREARDVRGSKPRKGLV